MVGAGNQKVPWDTLKEEAPGPKAEIGIAKDGTMDGKK